MTDTMDTAPDAGKEEAPAKEFVAAYRPEFSGRGVPRAPTSALRHAELVHAIPKPAQSDFNRCWNEAVRQLVDLPMGEWHKIPTRSGLTFELGIMRSTIYQNAKAAVYMSEAGRKAIEPELIARGWLGSSYVTAAMNKYVPFFDIANKFTYATRAATEKRIAVVLQAAMEADPALAERVNQEPTDKRPEPRYVTLHIEGEPLQISFTKFTASKPPIISNLKINQANADVVHKMLGARGEAAPKSAGFDGGRGGHGR